MKRLLSTFLMGFLFASVALFAQDGSNPLEYESLAQQFSTSNMNGDANAAILPSVAMENGFGTYLDNPAALAFIKDSYFTLGYFNNQAENQSAYLGQSNSLNGNNGRFSNVGIVYSVPTTQGSLVLGGGYSLNSASYRQSYLSAFNNQSTITDVFKNSSSQYYDIAFDTYATDYLYDSVPAGQINPYESIFRIGLDTYPGIYQTSELTYSSNSGELSLFGATEFQENIFIGASFSVVTGSHSIDRGFLESDRDDVYNSGILFQEDGGTDINSVRVEDEINSEILGVNLRIGSVYKITENFNIGASYLLPSRMFITEDYVSGIQSTFDDGSSTDLEGFSGDFSYQVRRPGQLNLGMALTELNGFSVSTSFEFIDYSKTELDLTTDPDLTIDDISYLREDQNAINESISRNYRSVTNIKAGIEYTFEKGYELRTGVSFLPGKSEIYTADRTVFAAGLGLPLSQNIFLDISSQYSSWDDRSVVYSYYDDGAGQWSNETVQESLSQLNILVGLKFKF